MAKQKVVVGVDGSPASLAALREALEEARLRGASLRLVTAWQLTWSEIAIESPFVVQKVEQHHAEILEAALASVDDGQAGGVEISGELLSGHPVSELLAAARDATLLVVGTRGTSGIAGALVGSVAHAVIHHAQCPVLVVPPPNAET